MAAILRQSSRHAFYSNLFENISPPDFWSLADKHPDPVTHLDKQSRLVGSFGLSGSVPWLKDTGGTLIFIRKEDQDIPVTLLWIAPSLKKMLTLFRVSCQIKPDRWHSDQNDDFVKIMECY